MTTLVNLSVIAIPFVIFLRVAFLALYHPEALRVRSRGKVLPAALRQEKLDQKTMSSRQTSAQHLGRLACIKRSHDRYLLGAISTSVVTNTLVVAVLIVTLQIYDHVLNNRSEKLLLTFFVLTAAAFVMIFVLETTRSRIFTLLTAKFQSGLDASIFAAVFSQSFHSAEEAFVSNRLRDLETVRQFFASPIMIAIIDMPLTPVLLGVVFVIHPWLGWLATTGGIILVAVALTKQMMNHRAAIDVSEATFRAERLSNQLSDEADLLQTMGMRGTAFARWSAVRSKEQAQKLSVRDQSNLALAFNRTFRILLQLTLLGLASYLITLGELTIVAAIGSFILTARALAPVELAIYGWATLHRSRVAWKRLTSLLDTVAPREVQTPLPKPSGVLEAKQLTVVPPGSKHAALRMVSFRAEPGQAIGVIGTSGAGKSTLARAITGIWHAAAGSIRLDGATLEQYDPQILGSYLGYLPQRVTLFDGTVAENIARMELEPNVTAVVSAAKMSGAHDMILSLPEGYDTNLNSNGGRLSGGQIQRIGLARALYGDPLVLVLDEPNSNLDNEGSLALNNAIKILKKKGCSILIMAHRPAAIQECDFILMLDGGQQRAFGPRDEVLKSMIKNKDEISRSFKSGDVA